MLMPLKAFFQLIVATITFGSVACSCPVQAASEGGSDTEHHVHMQPSAAAEACQHSECVTECSRVSANSTREDAMPCKDKVDDSDALEPDFIATFHRARYARWTVPPPHLWLAHDTPVRRFDRLLD